MIGRRFVTLRRPLLISASNTHTDNSTAPVRMSSLHVPFHTTIVPAPPRDGAVVEMVSVVVTVAPLGVSVAGENAHALCVGNPEHEKVTGCTVRLSPRIWATATSRVRGQTRQAARRRRELDAEAVGVVE